MYFTVMSKHLFIYLFWSRENYFKLVMLEIKTQRHIEKKKKSQKIEKSPLP